jgi:acyl-CoA thioester hydrolase
MTQPATPPSPRDRAFYSHWHSIPIRHADLDDLHHVNNTVYAVYCEEARRHFFQSSRQIQREHGTLFFIARLAIDFHHEMTWPGVIDIGTAVTRIGNSSFTMMQGVFSGETCHASAEVVTVVASQQTRRSTPIPAPLREFLARSQPHSS